MPADSQQGSRTLGGLYAATAVGFGFLAVLWATSGDYLRSITQAVMAGAWGIFALDHLVWPGSRPLIANVLLGAIVATLVVLGYVAFA